MAEQIYFSVFTTQGLALLTEAIQNGTKLGITSMAFGDGGGSLPTPEADVTSLVNEVHRTSLNSLAPDPKNANWLRAEAIIASAIGGFNIRELGLYAGDVLVAYSNYPPTFKPNPSDGTARIMTFRIVLQIDNLANFELVIDPDVVLATVQHVEAQLVDSKIKTSFGRSLENKNKDNLSLTDFYRAGDMSMDAALERAFYYGRSIFIPSDEFIFLEDHIIAGDKLELWGDGLLIAKSLNFLKFTGKRVKINGFSLEAFNHDSMINAKLLSVDGEKCKIDDIDVIGNSRAAIGIETTGVLNKIHSCRLNGFNSYNGSTQAIRSVTAYGSIITNNEIWNLNSEKDAGSQATASSRAVYHMSTVAEVNKTVISRNIIRNVFGKEGDAIHVIFNGGAAHLDSRTSIKDNDIDGFSRRAIKVQANGVKVKNNEIESKQLKADFPDLNTAIDIQYSSGCDVVGNTVDVLDAGCIQVYGGNSANLPNARSNVVKGNTVKLRQPSNKDGYAIYCERIYDSVIRDNDVFSNCRGIGLGNSFDSAITGNILTGGHSTSVGIFATFTCSNLVVTNNNGIAFNCAQFIRSQAKESVVKNNYTKIGPCVQAYAEAVKTVYADNVNNGPEFTTYGTFTDQYIVNGGINMQGFNTVPKILFADDHPATVFPNLRFNKGDKVFPRYPSATSGSPLGWVATQNGVGTAASWVVSDTTA